MEFIAAFISLLLLYTSLIITSPTDPLLKMTKYLLSYSYACLHYCRSWYRASLQFVIHQSNPSWPITNVHMRELYGLGQPLRGLGGKLEAFPQSHNPLNLRTQNHPISCFLRYVDLGCLSPGTVFRILGNALHRACPTHDQV